MSELFIGRLSATAIADPHEEDDDASLPSHGSLASRVSALLANLADHRLEEALAGINLPEGQWCLRRLDLHLDLDPGRPGPTLESQWAAALVQKLEQLLRSGSDDVLHFPRISDAVNDMTASLITGQFGNTWAWRQLGLLSDQDPDPAGAPAQLLLTTLHRRPELALPAVVFAVAAHGAAPLARILGLRDWSELTTIIATASGVPQLAEAASLSHDPGTQFQTRLASQALGGGRQVRPASKDSSLVSDEQLVESIAATIASGSTLARAFRHSGFRPDEPTAPAWALLATAELDAGLLRRADTPALLGSLSRRFLEPAVENSWLSSARKPANTRNEADFRETGHRAPNTDNRSVEDVAAARDNLPLAETEQSRLNSPADVRTDTYPEETLPGRAPAQNPEDAESAGRQTALPPTEAMSGQAAPSSPDPEQPTPTLWAGLPFLLATAADAGIPEQLLSDPALTTQPLRWILFQLGQLLVPVAPFDPALLAFTGLPPGADPPARLGVAEASSAERVALARHANRWALVTATRLGRAHLEPLAVVLEVASRHGSVAGKYGWLEVHLNLAEVDVAVRRAGMDLDPGWIPWLGTVVRYVYT